MTYASRSRSFVERSDAAAISNPMPAFRTRKRIVRPACESPSYGPRTVVEFRAEVRGRRPFEEMFVAARPKFVALAHAILRNREDAEDAVQNAFLSGCLHLRSFEGRSALSTWFTRIVLNAALMMRRKRKSSRIQPLPENRNAPELNWTEIIPASAPDPEMVCAEREIFDCINGILGKMKPLLRQAFTMTYYDELSGREASALLGVSAGTFKARLFRAKQHVFDQTERALAAPLHKRIFRRPNSRFANDSSDSSHEPRSAGSIAIPQHNQQ